LSKDHLEVWKVVLVDEIDRSHASAENDKHHVMVILRLERQEE
jgi:hypothetical protein